MMERSKLIAALPLCLLHIDARDQDSIGPVVHDCGALGLKMQG